MKKILRNSTHIYKEPSVNICQKSSSLRNWSTEDSWPEMLKTYQLSPEGSSKNEEIELSSETLRVCYSCKYSIDVKRNAGFSLRTYVWSGGMETVNGQATEWCFAYGEADWLAGNKFKNIKKDARGDSLAEPPIAPKGRVDCQ